jgi:conjugal transfer pilus assembly protein TraU
MIKRIIASLVLLVSVANVSAETIAEAACPDANIWEKLITQVCWSCMFPIYMAGARLGDGEYPDGSNDGPFCVCFNELGIPEMGFSSGMWAPYGLMEVVRMPYCSPALGGIVVSDSFQTGGYLTVEDDMSDMTSYQYHYYSFPLMQMLEIFMEESCNAGGYVQFDMLYLSELDPTWMDDELAFHMNPEVAVFSNPAVLASCSVDCTATATSDGFEDHYWCAGCWGNLYPFTGNITAGGSPVRDTSLIATRAMAALHRRGMFHKTYGRDAMCGGSIYPMIPKQQYRMSMLFPVPEADDGSCCHPIGRSTFLWGEWRNRPGQEDYLYALWRYQDCCMN